MFKSVMLGNESYGIEIYDDFKKAVDNVAYGVSVYFFKYSERKKVGVTISTKEYHQKKRNELLIFEDDLDSFYEVIEFSKEDMEILMEKFNEINLWLVQNEAPKIY